MSDLSVFIHKAISVVTCDGRIIVGILEGFDQTMNMILSQSHERVFSLDEPVSVIQLGLYVIRGDNVAVVGLIEEEIDGNLDYGQIRAEPIPAITH